MGKLIFILIIIGVAYFYFFNKPEVNSKKENSKTNKNDKKDLIMCDNCKTFVSEDEIKKVNGKNLCKECYDNLK